MRKRHSSAKGAGSAGKTTVRQRKDQSIRLIRNQQAEGVRPMRMHANRDQRAVTADRSERNQSQVAARLQVELNLTARHLIHAAA
jgi:hypothetical protein